MTDASAPAFQGHGSKGYRAYVLGVLLVVYTFNFVDRILIGIVGEDLKHDLGVSDFQLGLLGGPFFAVLYTLLGIPIARYAERANRITIVSIGAAIWSLMTAVCGFTTNFWQLALARIGVGIGEAACIPPSHSAISDYFPADRRASALGIFALGIPIGTMMAAVGGGWLVQNFDWRAAFWLLGAPGLVAALVLKLTVREPPRSGAALKVPTFGETLAVLGRKTSFWHVAFAGALMSFVGYANAQFLVSFTVRNYGLSIADASYAFGAIAGFAVAIGTFLGGFLGDRLSERHPRVLSWLPALGICIAVPAYAAAFLQPTFAVAFAILMVAPIFHYLYLGPMFAVTQSVAEPRTRATAAALLLLIVNLIGYGFGPPTIGALADYFSAQALVPAGLLLDACRVADSPAACGPAQAQGIKYALAGGVVVMLWAAVHFLLAGRTLVRDRVG